MTPQKTKFKQKEIGLIPEEWERKIFEYKQIGIYNRSFICQFKSIQ